VRRELVEQGDDRVEHAKDERGGDGRRVEGAVGRPERVEDDDAGDAAGVHGERQEGHQARVLATLILDGELGAAESDPKIGHGLVELKQVRVEGVGKVDEQDELEEEEEGRDEAGDPRVVRERVVGHEERSTEEAHEHEDLCDPVQ
jgi:hypothetical protein